MTDKKLLERLEMPRPDPEIPLALYEYFSEKYGTGKIHKDVLFVKKRAAWAFAMKIKDRGEHLFPDAAVGYINTREKFRFRCWKRLPMNEPDKNTGKVPKGICTVEVDKITGELHIYDNADTHHTLKPYKRLAGMIITRAYQLRG